MEVNTIVQSPIVKIAAAVIIIAGLVAAKAIVLPILLAVFITILTSPLLLWLEDKGLNSAFALIGIILLLVSAMTLLGLLLSSSLNDFSSNLPLYETKLKDTISIVLNLIHQEGFEFSNASVIELINPSKMALFASDIIKGFGTALTNGFMVLLLVIFMLAEATVFPLKIQAINVHASSHVNAFLMNVKRYMQIKSIFSFITGLLVYVCLLIIGLDYALVWAVLAFLLNFVPNIGSIIAAVPAVLLALVQLGLMGALEVSIVFVVVNVVLGSILEPKYMGKGLGLSTLVVFISLLFWGWVFGPVGMLLSIPLTIMLKLAFQVNPDTQWISILMGSGEEKVS